MENKKSMDKQAENAAVKQDESISAETFEEMSNGKGDDGGEQQPVG